MKKTRLVMKLATDVTQLLPAQLQAYKAFFASTFEPLGFDVSFELLYEDQAGLMDTLLDAVRAEFRSHDSQESDEAGQ
jgi:hypothetical protein